MDCSECNRNIPDDSNYCCYCGTPISDLASNEAKLNLDLLMSNFSVALNKSNLAVVEVESSGLNERGKAAVKFAMSSMNQLICDTQKALIEYFALEKGIILDIED